MKTISKTFIKEDKNGTKYFRHIFTCGRCGGSGYVPFNYAQGICFDCHGSGRDEEILKEYTPEYEAKLNKRREARNAKKHQEWLAHLDEQIARENERFLRINGFSSDGITWIFLGDTFSIKEELKAQGAKFDYRLGWHADHSIPEFSSVALTVSQLCKKKEMEIDGEKRDGSWEFIRNDEIEMLIREANRNNSNEPESQHVGNVGEKIEITATFTAEHSFETHFNYHTITNYIYTFTDESGNVFIWKTTAIIWEKTGTKIKLKGTIKAHGEFRNIKQTELMRCKITKI